MKKRKSRASQERIQLLHQIKLWQRRIRSYERKHDNIIYSEAYYRLSKLKSDIESRSKSFSRKDYSRYTERFYEIRKGEVEKMFVQSMPKKKELPSIKVGGVYEFEPGVEALPFYTTIIDEWYEYLSRKNVKKSTDIIARIKTMFDNLIEEFGKEVVGQILLLEQGSLPNLNNKIDYHEDLERFPSTIMKIMIKYAKTSNNKDVILSELKNISVTLNEDFDKLSRESTPNEN